MYFLDLKMSHAYFNVRLVNGFLSARYGTRKVMDKLVGANPK